MIGVRRVSTGMPKVQNGWSRQVAIVCAALLASSLAACGPKEPDPNEMFGSSVTAMDHDPSDTFVRNVYVDGTWVGQGGTGGSIVLGGISLPYRWRPGLTAVVKWERCEPYGKNCRWTERVVLIQKYDELAMSTWLHILPGNEVRLINSPYAPDHPDYPGPSYPTKDFFNVPPKPSEASR